LRLGDNNLNEIPDELGALENLEELTLHRNQGLGGIPFTCTSLVKLRLLTLYETKIENYPWTIHNWPFLAELYIKNNARVVEIPGLYHLMLAAIGTLVNLKVLDSQGCGITNIPEEMGDCKHLTSLNLAKNMITSYGIPYTFGDLELLTSLNLSKNSMDSIPDEIFKLMHLHDLDLSSNSISLIPSDIKHLVNISKLVLNNNKIESIPASIWYTTADLAIARN
jgi:Leucine-rich repeat (LRR) protein